jgi:hypothetical protein
VRHASTQISALRVCKELAEGDRSIIKLIAHLTDIETRALLQISDLRRGTRPDSAEKAFRSAMSLSKGSASGVRRSHQNAFPKEFRVKSPSSNLRKSVQQIKKQRKDELLTINTSPRPLSGRSPGSPYHQA